MAVTIRKNRHLEIKVRLKLISKQEAISKILQANLTALKAYVPNIIQNDCDLSALLMNNVFETQCRIHMHMLHVQTEKRKRETCAKETYFPRDAPVITDRHHPLR